MTTQEDKILQQIEIEMAKESLKRALAFQVFETTTQLALKKVRAMGIGNGELPLQSPELVRKEYRRLVRANSKR